MKIRILGSGTPTPSLNRMSSGYLFEIDEDVILMDCGPGVYHRLMEAGISATQVSHLFLSHLHYDHCLDYVRLLLTRWDHGAGLIPELNVYGPPPLKEMNDRLFSEKGSFAPDIHARIKHQGSVGIYQQRGGSLPRMRPNPNIRELGASDEVSGNSWKLTSFEVIHMQPYLACYGYKLRTDEGTVVYTGDTKPCDRVLEEAQGCDVLIGMCQFISGSVRQTSSTASTGHRELAEMAAQANVKSLVASHINHQWDVPGIREKIISEIAQIYSGNIFLAHDLMEIPIGNPEPKKYS